MPEPDLPGQQVESGSALPGALLRTKLYRPRVAGEILHRERLHLLLGRTLAVPLTVVSGPAGYGKSTAVSDWCSTAAVPNAWLSLDAEDGDPIIFLSCVIAAMRTIMPAACPQTWSYVSAPKPPPIPVVVKTLVNELDAIREPWVLALDDYHRIEAASPVHEILNRILDHPPKSLHLVIMTRRDPPIRMAALRGGGLMMEVRLQDLRFTESETVAFLEEAAGVRVERKALSNVQERTEGWAVGLRLVSLYLRTVDDPDAFLATFPDDPQHVREYLLEEVLSRQPVDVREALLKTSLLDRFCAGLCDSVRTNASGSRPSDLGGEQFIALLRSGNLFTIPLDGEGRWFRYHHLFQELLSAQLAKHAGREEIEAIHRRASEWLETEGLIDEAIRHALAADDEELAGLIVERRWRSEMNEGNWHRVAGWLSRLPDTVIEKSPQLLLALAFKRMYHLDVGAIPPLVERVDALSRVEDGEPEFSGEVAMFRGFCAYFMDEGAQSLQFSEYAVERLPAEDVEFRGLAEVMFGLAAQMQGQLERAYGIVKGWIEEPTPRPAVQRANRQWIAAFTHYGAGDLDTAARHAPRLIKAAESGGADNWIAWGLLLDGRIHLQRGHSGAAIPLLERAVEKKHLNHARAAADASGTLAMAYQVNGRRDDAAEALLSFSDFAMDLGEPFEELARAQAARIAILDDRTEVALRWLRETERPSALGMMSWFVQPGVTRCRALIAEGSRRRLQQAEDELRELADRCRATHNACQLVHILPLLSMACSKQEREEEALSALDEALTIAEPGGFVFPFQELGAPVARLLTKLPRPRGDADFVAHVLAAMQDFRPATGVSADQPRANPELVEGLTPREEEVLELLAQRLRDKEIAEKLFVATETVNSHLKHIYEKLAVRNRRDAVARGAELGLVSPP